MRMRFVQRFGEATGVPVVLNTSFNLRGGPIVTTPENAYSTFRRSEMDLLVMGNCLVAKFCPSDRGGDWYVNRQGVTVEDACVEEVITAIKRYDPFAIVRATQDTYEEEDLYLYVYTDRDSVDLLRHVAEVTVRLSEEEDFHVVVLPMRKDDMDDRRQVEDSR